MKPVVITGAEVAMHAPEGWDEDRHGKCETIQARDNGDGTYSLGWRPSRDELEQLALGAAVVIDMWGGVAPHCLKVEDMPGATSPFSESDGASDAQALDRNAAANAGEKPSALRDDETPESREAKAADAFEESRRKQEAIIASMKRDDASEREAIVARCDDLERRAGVKSPDWRGEAPAEPVTTAVPDIAVDLLRRELGDARSRLASRREWLKEAEDIYRGHIEDVAEFEDRERRLIEAIRALGGNPA